MNWNQPALANGERTERRQLLAAHQTAASELAFGVARAKPHVHDLATGRHLLEKVPVLIAGPCGTGKSHLAQALGHCAVRQGTDAVFTTCAP